MTLWAVEEKKFTHAHFIRTFLGVMLIMQKNGLQRDCG